MKRSDCKFRSKLHQPSDFGCLATSVATSVSSHTGFETPCVLVVGCESMNVSKNNQKLDRNDTKGRKKPTIIQTAFSSG